MSRNKTTMLIIAIAILVFSIGASVTEYREVSSYEWNEKYRFDDKDPLGLYIFKELTSRYFKDIPIKINNTLEDTINQNGLYIQFVPVTIDYEVVDTILSIASKGNDVLIIGDYLNERISDTIPHYFESVYNSDSTLTFNFTNDSIAEDIDYIYKFQNRKFDQIIKGSFHLLQGSDWDEDQQYIRVATPDSLALMISFPFGKGRIFYHAAKDLFYNYSFRQSQMFEYSQKIYSHFDPEHIHLIDPKTASGSGDLNDTNPLDFIMSQPALKTAYYLLILGVLLYVFFGGKRKQKIIPVLEKNENTSLEYIETVSQLFYQQGQHEKLVAHMRNIFHHKMQKRYFVTPDNPNYVQVLAKKSKISATELQYIKDRFQNLDDNFGFRGDQLVSLNRRLEKIYKEIEAK